MKLPEFKVLKGFTFADEQNEKIKIKKNDILGYDEKADQYIFKAGEKEFAVPATFFDDKGNVGDYLSPIPSDEEGKKEKDEDGGEEADDGDTEVKELEARASSEGLGRGPTLVDVDAKIKNVAGDDSKNVLQVLIDDNSAARIMRHKPHWKSIRIVICGNFTDAELEKERQFEEEGIDERQEELPMA